MALVPHWRCCTTKASMETARGLWKRAVVSPAKTTTRSIRSEQLSETERRLIRCVNLDAQLVGADIVAGVDEDLHELERRVWRVVAHLVDERLGAAFACHVAILRRKVVQQRHLQLTNACTVPYIGRHTILMAIALSNLNRFSQFFHWRILR